MDHKKPVHTKRPIPKENHRILQREQLKELLRKFSLENMLAFVFEGLMAWTLMILVFSEVNFPLFKVVFFTPWTNLRWKRRQ